MLDMHTHVWPHQPGTPVPSLAMLEKYCEAAGKEGIGQIAITEHSHRFVQVAEHCLPHWTRPTIGAAADATAHVLEVEGGADLDAYVGALGAAQDRGLPILIGLEVDHLPGAGDAMTELLAGYPFDVLLGSVHWLDEWLFDAYGTSAFLQRWNESNIDEVFAQYVDAVVELAHSGAVDVLAHLDVIKVAGHIPERLGEHHHRLISELVGAPVVIEVSSAGLRKPVAEIYPSPDLLDLVVDAGFGLTTASDAHVVEQIGTGFDRLRAELDRRDIHQLATFDRRRRVMVDR